MNNFELNIDEIQPTGYYTFLILKIYLRQL